MTTGTPSNVGDSYPGSIEVSSTARKLCVLAVALMHFSSILPWLLASARATRVVDAGGKIGWFTQHDRHQTQQESGRCGPALNTDI